MSQSQTSVPNIPSQALLDDRSFVQILRHATTVLIFSLGIPMLVLLALVFVLIRSAKLVEHTDHVIAEAHEVQKMLVTMQTSFRGFRLSTEIRYLNPYTEGTEKILSKIDSLAALVADNPNQVKQATLLKEETSTWIKFVNGELTDIDSGITEARNAKFLTRGVALFDTPARRLNTFIKTEETLRTARDLDLKRIVTATLTLFALAALVGIPVLTLWLQRLLKKVSSSYKASLIASEQRATELQVTLTSIGDAVIATDAEGRVDFLNPVAERLMGWTTAEVRGRLLTDVFDIFNEYTKIAAENPVDRVLRENVVVGLANHTILRSRTGIEIPIEDSAAPIRNEAGEVSGVILVFHDVSEKHEAEHALKKSEWRHRFLNNLGEATRTLIDPTQIMHTSAEMLGKLLDASRCAYAEVADDGNHFTILHDYTRDCKSTVGEYKLHHFGSKAVEELNAAETFVLNHVSTQLTNEEGAGMFAAINIEAIVCCPLIKEGRLRALMAVHQTTPRRWTSSEISLIEEVVERCWATIERARAEAEAKERARLSALRADIAAELDLGKPLDQTLQGCSELLSKYLDASLTRIWTLDADETMLSLRSSAGLHTKLEGPHYRIPVGELKIGRIAQNKRPLLTNDVAHDPNITDADWARQEGMVAFAGYPLMIEGDVLGVLGVFAKHVLSEAVLSDLDPIANVIAQHIDRKAAESALQIAIEKSEADARAAAESAERFKLLGEVVSLQVWTATLDGLLDYANEECIKYFGVQDSSQVLGRGWTQFVHPDDLPAANVAWQKSLASGKRYEVEFRLQDASDQDYHWFLVRAELMRDHEGKPVKWFGTNTLIDELKIAQSEAERASRAKDNFLASLSHELRTPLTPVLMTAAALREDERLPTEVREQLSMMERNIALEARLIDDLLDLTSISRGKLHLRTQPCDTHSLIGLALDIVRDDANAKEISFEREFNALRSGLQADPSRFQQVIWNLLRNAVKFTPRGGRISIRTYDGSDNRLRIEVEDSGIGIEATALHQIFLPFEQGGLTGDHRFGGVGLGLAIARTIVDLHGGVIKASSPGINRGSTFTVEFPDSIEPPHGVSTSHSAQSSTDVSAPLESKQPTIPLRLLLVEDHIPTLQVLKRLLTRAGHHVVPASSVEEACAAAAANTFDLVISDLGLPDGTGIELMTKLRAAYGLKGIALSGYGMEEDIVRSLEAGFITHLIKPVDFNQLMRALNLLA